MLVAPSATLKNAVLLVCASRFVDYAAKAAWERQAQVASSIKNVCPLKSLTKANRNQIDFSNLVTREVLLQAVTKFRTLGFDLSKITAYRILRAIYSQFGHNSASTASFWLTQMAREAFSGEW
jgi:hypothetical protein